MNRPHRGEDFEKGTGSGPAPDAATRADGPPAGELNALAMRTARQLSADSYSPAIVSGMLRLFEFAGFSLTGFLVLFAYLEMRLGESAHYTLAILVGSSLAVAALQLADAYPVPAMRSAGGTLPRALVAWTATFGVLAAVAFFLKLGELYSRVWFASWFACGAIFLVLCRIAVSMAIRKWARNGRMERRAVIVGGGTTARDLIRSMERERASDIRICGIFDDRTDERSPQVVAGYPKLGNLADLVAFVRLARVDMLIISLPLDAEARVLEMLKPLWVLPIDIRLAAHANRLRFRTRSYSYVGGVPMLDILDRPIADWDSVAKRIFDVAFSLVALALLWPVMLAAAVAVKATSSGPVIFRQKRHGFNNEEIDVYKFRSMFTEMCDPGARALVTKGDPRVTPVGRFIRKTSIDELPQLVNVLKGDLSLVGPRPHAPHAQANNRLYVEVVDGYFARHRVKPGVTGWAQINGWRGETDTEEKIRQRTSFDLYYIENWSLFLDLKILFLTPFRLFGSENAY